MLTRALLDGPLGAAYRDPDAVAEFGARFRAEGYVKLPGLLGTATMAGVGGEIAAGERHATARDFVMPGPNTPRVMSVLGARQLLQHSPALAILYVHFELVGLISRLTGGPVYSRPHPDEVMVCNFLRSHGSTHGWHLDDPPFALVLVLEAPGPGCGGDLECVPEWDVTCSGLGHDPRGPVADAVADAHVAGAIKSIHHDAGDAYLLRADRCLHRVTPLDRPGARRAALNFANEATPSPTYGDSATMLYASTARPRRLP